MNIKELLPSIGIKETDIEFITGNMDISVDNGYDVSTRDIKTRKAILGVYIYPNVKWTDGSCRPAYGSLEYGVFLGLNKRLKEN